QRISGGVQQLAPLCGPPLLLRMPTRQEHLLAGGDAADFDPSLPPGGGVWRGARLQVVRCAPAGAAPAPVSVEVDLGQQESFAIVTSRPTELADRILAARPSAVIRQLGGEVGDPRSLFVGRGGPAELLIGDADAWQAHWGAFAAVRASVSVLFDACSMAEYRQLTRSRELPPPPEEGAVALWLLAGSATPQRARIVGLSS
ncbi:MAG: cell division protein, partial [Glaciihabitans sp.]|nr:cell division protein [Glaciihabitans sp.]